MFRRTHLIFLGEIVRRKSYYAKLMPKIWYYNQLKLEYMLHYTL